MKYFCKDNNIIIEKSAEFDLAQTFDCGQCFRWNLNSNGTYTGIAYGRVITASNDDNGITLHNLSEADFKSIWLDYFDLLPDYKEIKTNLAAIHPVLGEAAEFAGGIRILNQEPWEALCSFIISQNNNIPRIKKIISALCTDFGEKINRSDFYAFPTADRIASCKLDDLSAIRAGFRAKYILDAAQKVSNGDINFEKIKKLPVNELREQLMTIKGVGPKVADCTMLYGMHKMECFPLDVWMKRAMADYFEGLTPESFGKYAGIAQQYIFHYVRANSGKV